MSLVLVCKTSKQDTCDSLLSYVFGFQVSLSSPYGSGKTYKRIWWQDFQIVDINVNISYRYIKTKQITNV